MNKLFKVLLIAFITFNFAFALKKEDIKDTMSNKIDSALVILKDKNLDTDKKANELFGLFDEIFDYELMAKISLGKSAWVEASSEQQKEYLKLFEERLKASYIDKLELYTNQKIEIVDLVPYKGSRLQLKTKIIAKDETYKVHYNFYNKQGSWLIYDVNLLGVSIIKTYRNQFAGILKNKSFDELLEILKEKNRNNG